MSSLATRQPTVIVDSKAQTDAALVERDGERFLVLQPVQTFSNAVSQITHLLPSMHPNEVRRLVRWHLPTAMDFDTMESSLRVRGPRRATTELLPPLTRRERRRSFVRRALVQGVLGSIASLSLVAYFVVDGMEAKPFESEAFKRFAEVGKMMCDPIDATHARCTDVDGMVMLSTVVTSPEYTVFNFSYGAEKVSMRVYPTTRAAQVAISEPANQKMYLNIAHAGRYLFYGTDEDRLTVYLDMVRDAGDKGRAVHSTVTLPERVAGLAFGALSLPAQDEIELVSATQARAVRALMGEAPPTQDEAPVVVVSARGKAVAAQVESDAVRRSAVPIVDAVVGALVPALPKPAARPTTKPPRKPVPSKPPVHLPAPAPLPTVPVPLPSPSPTTPLPVPAPVPLPTPSEPTVPPTEPAQPAPPEVMVDAVDTVVDAIL